MNKTELLGLALIFGLLGGGAVWASSRVLCLLGECVFLPPGATLFSRNTQRVDSTIAQATSISPYVFFGLSGCLLIGGLVKND